MNLLLTGGSTILALTDLASMWLLARHHRAGWAIGIATEALWTPYNITTRQYGFLALTIVSVPVYIRGWHNFTKENP